MKIRKIFIAFICIIMMFSLASCVKGKYKIRTGKIIEKDNVIQGDYSGFEGYYNKKIKLGRDEKINIRYAQYTAEGDLSVKIMYFNDNIIENIEVGITEFVSEKKENYKIKITGTNHTGVFAVEWEIK